MNSLLYTQYAEDAVPKMVKQFGYKNRMQAPRLTKAVVNIGYGKHAKDKALVEHMEKTLTMITGQKPVHNKSKKSISNFKIHEGQPIGASVTLRGNRMYDFLYKLVHLTLPRVRDFRGLSKNSFDGRGNYTLGLKEQVAFPEVTPQSSDKFYGLEVTVVTSAKSKAEGLALLSALGFPFREK
jgi:large subunit ribosomal protein L5